MQKAYFVSGIGTDVGKTVVSAFLCRCLDAHYWKPIQAGELDFSDSAKVQRWSRRRSEQIHPEAFRFSTPASPHYAAQKEEHGSRIYARIHTDTVGVSQNHFQLPNTNQPLIVEGAGGLLVPINEQETMLDLIQAFQLPVLLVARNYLGSINHSLLSIQALKHANIPLTGLIYSGANYRDNIEIIEKISGVSPLVQLPELAAVTPEAIDQLADEFGAVVCKALL